MVPGGRYTMDGDLKRLLLPVLFTLGVGTYVGTKFAETPDDERSTEASLRTLENSVRVSSEALFTQILGFVEQDTAAYYAELEVKNSSLVPLSQKPVEAEVAQFYLKQAAARLMQLRRDLKPGEVIEFRVRPDGAQNIEWLGFMYGSKKKFGHLSLRLIDPRKAFTSIQGAQARIQGADLRSFLITEDGRVLAHSVAALAGADFSKLTLMTSLRSLNERRQRPSGRTEAAINSFDKLPVLAAWSRVGTLPLYVVNEQAVWGGSSANRSRTQPITRNEALVLAGVLLFFWIRFARKRRGLLARTDVPTEVPVIRLDETPPSVQQAVASVGKPQPLSLAVVEAPIIQAMQQSTQVQAELSRLRLELSSSKKRIDQLERTSTLVRGIQSDLDRMDDPRAIAKRLTEGAKELCDVTAMFLLYQARSQSAAVLQVSTDNSKHLGLSFQVPIEDRLQKRIIAAAEKGDIPVLREYAPIARMLLAKTGCPRFEAWALVLSGQTPRLLGFLLVLKERENQALPLTPIHRMLRQAQERYETAFTSKPSEESHRRRPD
jgi:hypothetical protein